MKMTWLLLQDKVLHQLLHHNVQVEQLGGDTQAISISAITVSSKHLGLANIVLKYCRVRILIISWSPFLLKPSCWT